MPEFTQDWFDRYVTAWRSYFDKYGFTADQPRTAIEIGSFEGRSTLWLLDNLLAHPDSRIYCVDTFAGGAEHEHLELDGLWNRFNSNIKESPHASKVTVGRGLSRSILPKLLEAGVRADFIYVDGSHQAPDVLQDLVLSFLLLKEGGMMICDDYLWFQDPPSARDLLYAPKLAIDAFANIFIRKLNPIRGHPLQFAFIKLSD